MRLQDDGLLSAGCRKRYTRGPSVAAESQSDGLEQGKAGLRIDGCSTDDGADRVAVSYSIVEALQVKGLDALGAAVSIGRCIERV